MPSRNIDARALLVLCAFAVLILLTGCAQKKVQAAAPATSAPSASAIATPPPSTTAPDTTAMPPVASATPPPDIPTATATPPPIVTPTTKPARPQKPSPEPATVTEEHSRPPAPQISPELSEGEKANLQRGLREDAAVADSNLKQANGKRLNAQQNDLMDKIKGFLDQSSAAAKEGDLARAKNLAQKARVLSVELVNSL
jgi:hypothetical protein